jgi:putative ABC transport system permease protein
VIRLSGRYRSALLVGLQGIRARKLRTLLSMVSLFLGVLAVVVVQAGSELAHRALLANVELTNGKDGTHQLFLPPDPKVISVALDTMRGRTDGVASLQAHGMIGEPNVTPVNPGGVPLDATAPGQYGGPGGVVVCDPSGGCFKAGAGSDGGGSAAPPPGQAVELGITAMTGDLRQFRPFRTMAGRWLDFSGSPSLAPRLVINKAAVTAFQRYRIPAQLHIDGAAHDPTPLIVGVVDDGNEQPAAYVRADELLNWLPLDSARNALGGGVQILTDPGAVDLEHILRARLVAGGVPADQLHFETVDAIKHISGELALTRWLFLGMAGLVLLIGVAGILNVGLATVGERVEEFALRRAVGTPRSLLAGIVLAETLLTGLLTATAAIAVAAAVLDVAGGYLGAREQSLTDLSFPWQAGVAGIVAGLVAGILGGLVPAIRAARIPIASIMRA